MVVPSKLCQLTNTTEEEERRSYRRPDQGDLDVNNGRTWKSFDFRDDDVHFGIAVALRIRLEELTVGSRTDAENDETDNPPSNASLHIGSTFELRRQDTKQEHSTLLLFP